MVQTDESHLLAELITGYTDITTKQSAEQSAIEELERYFMMFYLTAKQYFCSPLKCMCKCFHCLK